jgi:hypothetical protein
MLPLSQGGVVDTNLRVYGLTNVRVADSSVFPMQFAAHVRPFLNIITLLRLFNIPFG